MSMPGTPEYPIRQRGTVMPSEEWRSGPNARWRDAAETSAPDDDMGRWVEVRPKPQPVPLGIWLSTPPTAGIATTVGEMRDRTDLDQWEYADNEPGDFGWTSWTDLGDDWADADDDLPVVVRRKP